MPTPYELVPYPGRKAVVVEMTWRDRYGKRYRQLIISYEDGTGEFVRVPLDESKVVHEL